MSIRIAITDDHPLAINGINMMLSANPDIIVTNTYNSGTALMDGLKKDQPDILLLDILLPDKPGNELAPEISKMYPEVRIIALTSLDAPAVVKSMMAHGCIGYLLKGTDQETLLKAIDHAYQGKEFIEPTLKEHLLQLMLKPQKQTTSVGLQELTKREKEILLLIVEGLTTQEMADKLFISLRTAETHRITLLKKLNVKNTAGLVRMAFVLGLANSEG